MAFRYVVTREWGEHKIGDRLEEVDADHAHFAVRVPFSDAVEPPEPHPEAPPPAAAHG